MIGNDQARLTKSCCASPNSAKSASGCAETCRPTRLPLLMQAILLGRTLDDLSLEPISSVEWEQTLIAVVYGELNIPLHTV